jgi:hypothetical protein
MGGCQLPQHLLYPALHACIRLYSTDHILNSSCQAQGLRSEHGCWLAVNFTLKAKVTFWVTLGVLRSTQSVELLR